MKEVIKPRKNWLDKPVIRKAYFQSKLPKFLADVQAQQGIGESELEELKAYLEVLRAEDVNIIRALQLEKEEDEALIPDDVLEENLTPEQADELKKEKYDCERSRKLAEKLINNISKKILSRNNPSKDEIMDVALSLLGLTYYIDRETIFRERSFKKKVIEYVNQGIQRKEAEDFAKVSIEYRDLRLNEALSVRIKEFIMMAKKMYDVQR